MKKLVSMLLPILVVFANSSFALPANAESLGIGVTIIPDPKNPTLNSNSNLWFGGEPGSQMQRKLVITSASAIDQLITFSLLDLAIVDGEEYVDSQSTSEKSDWLVANPSPVVLSAGERVEVTLTMTIPTDAADSASISFLRIQASDAAGFDPNSEDAGTGTKAVLAGAAAVDIETWIGVGDALLLIPKFEFLPPQGIIRDGKKYIRSGFQNRGLVPLLVTGQLTLNDQTFAGRTFGPFEYQASGIEESQQGTFEVEVPEEVQEGPWQIYITARMGNVRENRLFTLDLTFVEENTFQPIWILYLLVTGALSLALVLGIRLIRSGRSERQAVKSMKTIRVKHHPTHNRESSNLGQFSSTPKQDVTERRLEVSAKATTDTKRPGPSVRTEEFQVQLDDWAEELRRSLREVKVDSQALIEKYQVQTSAKDTKTSKTGKTSSSKARAPKAASASSNSLRSSKSSKTKKSVVASPKKSAVKPKPKTAKGKK